MNFTSLTFALLVAVVFAVYWRLHTPRARNVVLVLASYAFYAWWDYRFCALLAFSTLVDYAVGLGLGRATAPRRRRLLLVTSLVTQLGLLLVFKYFGFFADNLTALLNLLGLAAPPLTLRLLLPLGISFYTLKTLSYTIDVYRGQMQPTASLVEYAAFVSFFPQLSAGPIERAARLLPQLRELRVFDRAQAVDGCRQILWGFAKKIVIADRLASFVEVTYSTPHASTGPQVLAATFCFAIQLYCDFSAYSDIAIGVARLFGFDTMRNFAAPYFSQNMVEFWRRWHISLSLWLRDYVYTPLDGAGLGRRLPLRWRLVTNTLITFLISGLWHGPAWTYVIWGGLQGLGMVPTLLARKPRVLRATQVAGGPGFVPRPAVAARMLATFLWTLLAWVFFRAASVPDALHLLGALPTGWAPAALRTHLGSLVVNVGMAGGFLLLEWFVRSHTHPLQLLDRCPRAVRWGVYTLLLWGAIFTAAVVSGPFFYFRF